MSSPSSVRRLAFPLLRAGLVDLEDKQPGTDLRGGKRGEGVEPCSEEGLHWPTPRSACLTTRSSTKRARSHDCGPERLP